MEIDLWRGALRFVVTSYKPLSLKDVPNSFRKRRALWANFYGEQRTTGSPAADFEVMFMCCPPCENVYPARRTEHWEPVSIRELRPNIGQTTMQESMSWINEVGVSPSKQNGENNLNQKKDKIMTLQ